MKSSLLFYIVALCLGFGLLWLTACTVKKTTTDDSGTSVKGDTIVKELPQETVVDQDKPKILFVNYSIRKEGLQVQMINQIISNGKIKRQPNASSTFQADDLKCVALDENKIPLSEVYVENPLHKSIEYQEENGQLARKEVEQDSATFFVRMQLTANARFIGVQQKGAANGDYLLTSEIHTQ